jgi:hypothetical protein
MLPSGCIVASLICPVSDAPDTPRYGLEEITMPPASPASCFPQGHLGPVYDNAVSRPLSETPPFKVSSTLRDGDYTLGWITSALQRSAAPLSGNRALQAEHLRLDSDPHLRYSPGSARHCGLGGPNTTKARASSSGIIQPGRRPRQRMLRRPPDIWAARAGGR